MKLNTKQWKKVKADDSYTYFQDSKRNELKIAHTTLSPKYRADLAALPIHMADGGEAKKDLEIEKADDKPEEEIKDIELKDAAPEASTPEPFPTSTPPPEMNAPQDNPFMQSQVPGQDQFKQQMAAAPQSAIGGAATADALPQAPASPEPSPVNLASSAPPSTVPLTGEQPAPAAPKDELTQAKDAQAQQMTGMAMEEAAIAKQAKAEQAAAQQSLKMQQHIASEFEQQNNKLMQEQMSIYQDMKDGHIDPQRVWHERSTAGKVATIVGIIASGWGAGLSGQENQAIKMLNQEIDRDVDAQKANLSHKGNMLAAISNQMGSLRAGTEMMRNIQVGMAASKMQEAAAAAKDPLAKARLMQNMGILQQQFLVTNQKIAAQMTVDKLSAAANSDPSKAGELLSAMRKVNPDAAKALEEKYVDGMGFARTAEGAKELRETVGAKNDVDSGVKRLLEINKISGKSMSPSLRAESEAISTGLMGPLRHMMGMKTLTESDIVLLDKMLKDPTHMASLAVSNRVTLETLMKRMDQGLAAKAQANGINYKPAPSAEDKQKEFTAWAKANPNDPRAKKILQLQGK
jgi:hypothetical protein